MSSPFIMLLTKVANETAIKAPIAPPATAAAKEGPVGTQDLGTPAVAMGKTKGWGAGHVGTPMSKEPAMPAKQSAAIRLEAVKLALDLGAIGKTVGDAAGSIGKGIADYKPFASGSGLNNILTGAAAGGTIGAATGVPRDREGKSHKLRNALLGALLGAGAGGLVQPLGRAGVKHMAQASSPRVEGLPLLGEPINKAMKSWRGAAADIASDHLITNKMILDAILNREAPAGLGAGQ